MRFCCISLCLFFSLQVFALENRVIVNFFEDNSLCFLWKDLRSIDFSSTDEVVVKLLDETSETFEKSTLRSFVFDEKKSFLNQPVSEASSIQIYPNPTKNTFVVKGLNGGEELCLIDLAGNKVLQRFATKFEVTEFDISSCLSGVYLLIVDGKQAVKVIKQ